MHTTTEIIEADERRVRRDSHRDAGGSKRRPLKSFLTDAEKQERRDAHAVRLGAAVGELSEPQGMERWLEAYSLNPRLSPMNVALVALQTPGEIVGTVPDWSRQGYKVRKGERAAGYLTGRGFWPTAYFTAEQANAGDLLEIEPEPIIPAHAFDLCVSLKERLATESAREALAALAATA